MSTGVARIRSASASPGCSKTSTISTAQSSPPSRSRRAATWRRACADGALSRATYNRSDTGSRCSSTTPTRSGFPVRRHAALAPTTRCARRRDVPGAGHCSDIALGRAANGLLTSARPVASEYVRTNHARTSQNARNGFPEVRWRCPSLATPMSMPSGRELIRSAFHRATNLTWMRGRTELAEAYRMTIPGADGLRLRYPLRHQPVPHRAASAADPPRPVGARGMVCRVIPYATAPLTPLTAGGRGCVRRAGSARGP